MDQPAAKYVTVRERDVKRGMLGGVRGTCSECKETVLYRPQPYAVVLKHHPSTVLICQECMTIERGITMKEAVAGVLEHLKTADPELASEYSIAIIDDLKKINSH
jgi:hypothetical protein